jgi:hypothetical protein
MSYETTNNSYTSLARIGSGSNPRNALVFTPTESTELGVSVSQEASKKAMTMEVIVPIARSKARSRRTARFTLNGAQARKLYETLNKFYATRADEEEAFKQR